MHSSSISSYLEYLRTMSFDYLFEEINVQVVFGTKRHNYQWKLFIFGKVTERKPLAMCKPQVGFLLVLYKTNKTQSVQLFCFPLKDRYIFKAYYFYFTYLFLSYLNISEITLETSSAPMSFVSSSMKSSNSESYSSSDSIIPEKIWLTEL